MGKTKAQKTESVRIDADVLKKARRYVKDTPMTLGGWISSELRAILNGTAKRSKSSAAEGDL